MWSFKQSGDLKVGSYLFRAAKLTENVDFDKYINILNMALDLIRREAFCYLLVVGCKYLIMFGYSLVTLITEKKYAINFSEQQKTFCLSLHYNGENNYLIVNSLKINKFKAKDSEINAFPLCLGNVSKDFSVDDMKKSGLYGYVFDFSIDNDSNDTGDVLDIHKCLMAKNNIK